MNNSRYLVAIQDMFVNNANIRYYIAEKNNDNEKIVSEFGNYYNMDRNDLANNNFKQETITRTGRLIKSQLKKINGDIPKDLLSNPDMKFAIYPANFII